MVASRNGHDPVVQLLIANKAIIDLKSKKKWTALMYGVHHGHVKVVRALLAARADPTVRDSSGKTAHDLAKEGKQNEILEHLSRHSASVTDVAVSERNRKISMHLYMYAWCRIYCWVDCRGGLPTLSAVLSHFPLAF